ncbi:MAG: YlxR family protein [Deltaproteobacteria bacterium]|nr:YlxR family protein [Deltaproteobacteria bacterium]
MGKSRGHIPIRTCISCGVRRDKNELIRLSLDAEGQLIKDIEGKMHGRGAYVCKIRTCQEQLSKNRRLHKLFRTDKVIVNFGGFNG